MDKMIDEHIVELAIATAAAASACLHVYKLLRELTVRVR